jgi:hypothetical protein
MMSMHLKGRDAERERLASELDDVNAQLLNERASLSLNVRRVRELESALDAANIAISHSTDAGKLQKVAVQIDAGKFAQRRELTVGGADASA